VRDFSIGSVIYIVVGVIIANNQGYLLNVASLSDILSAVLAVSLWPLLLVGINLNITL